MYIGGRRGAWRARRRLRQGAAWHIFLKRRGDKRGDAADVGSLQHLCALRHDGRHGGDAARHRLFGAADGRHAARGLWSASGMDRDSLPCGGVSHRHHGLPFLPGLLACDSGRPRPLLPVDNDQASAGAKVVAASISVYFPTIFTVRICAECLPE